MHSIFRLPPALFSLVFTVAYLFFYLNAPPLFADADVPWHIAAGDLIRALGALPATDPWSYTAEGNRWYIISWLWDVVASAVHEAGGTHALFCFTAAMTALPVAILAVALRARPGLGADALIFTLFLAALALVDFAVARPHLMAFALIPLSHALLHKSREGGWKPLLWLPAIAALWVNAHGSFLVLFTLLGAYGLEALVAGKRGWFLRLFVTAVVCLAALLLNPYGPGMIDAVMRTLNSVTTKYILEWLPFVFGNSMGLSAWLIVFVLASSLREKSIPVADKIITFLWLPVLLMSMRNAGIFVLVAAPYLAISLQRTVEALERFRTRRPELTETLERHGMEGRMALAALVSLAASFFFFGDLRGEAAINDERNDARQAIAHVMENYPAARLLNDYNFGGRIVYETGGRLKIFADGRAGTAYTEEVLADYLGFMSLDDGWKKTLDRYGIETILLGNGQRFAAAWEAGQYREQWRRVYHDDVASVFVRR